MKHPRPRPIAAPAVLLAAALFLGACAAGRPPAGSGLYRTYDDTRVAEVGYPNDLDQSYWWPAGKEGEWGILYDDEGVPYGPNTYYHHVERLDHPDLVVTDSTMTGRWFTMNRHDRSTEVMFGRWLELHDLAHQDMVDLLDYTPPVRIQVHVARTFPEYLAVTGKDYWVTQIADGPFISYEPMRALWARRLALHAVRNGVALVFLDMKCHGLVPPWLRQGLASYLAQEGGVLAGYVREFEANRPILWTPEQVIQHVHPLYDRDTGRIALYNAFLMTWHLAQRYGFDRIREVLDLLEQGVGFEDAVPRVYGVDRARLLELIDPTALGDPSRPGFVNTAPEGPTP